MKNYYLRLKRSKKNYTLAIYSNKGVQLDFVGSYTPGVGIKSSILRVYKSSLLFWVSKGLRPTLLLRKLLVVSNIL